MKANTGKIIRVDLNAGAVSIEMLPEDDYRNFVGGSGLAAKYFWDKGDFNADALSPEAHFHEWTFFGFKTLRRQQKQRSRPVAPHGALG
jgi:aldehyde:ferredoxin oxidoreductase